MKENFNLTNREIEILKYTAMGYTNSDIAEKLIISIHTVKIHLENIFVKLNIHNRIQATVVAIKNNIIDIESL